MPLLTIRMATIWLCTLAAPAHAQDWPAKPVKIVVPFTAGGSSDQLARLLAGELSAPWAPLAREVGLAVQ